jgi:hypothetical protein
VKLKQGKHWLPMPNADDPTTRQSNCTEAAQENQPLIGIIDTGFTRNNPDIDYSRIIVGRDRVDGMPIRSWQPEKSLNMALTFLASLAQRETMTWALTVSTTLRRFG